MKNPRENSILLKLPTDLNGKIMEYLGYKDSLKVLSTSVEHKATIAKSSWFLHAKRREFLWFMLSNLEALTHLYTFQHIVSYTALIKTTSVVVEVRKYRGDFYVGCETLTRKVFDGLLKHTNDMTVTFSNFSHFKKYTCVDLLQRDIQKFFIKETILPISANDRGFTITLP